MGGIPCSIDPMGVGKRSVQTPLFNLYRTSGALALSNIDLDTADFTRCGLYGNIINGDIYRDNLRLTTSGIWSRVFIDVLDTASTFYAISDGKLYRFAYCTTPETFNPILLDATGTWTDITGGYLNTSNVKAFCMGIKDGAIYRIEDTTITLMSASGKNNFIRLFGRPQMYACAIAVDSDGRTYSTSSEYLGKSLQETTVYVNPDCIDDINDTGMLVATDGTLYACNYYIRNNRWRKIDNINTYIKGSSYRFAASASNITNIARPTALRDDGRIIISSNQYYSSATISTLDAYTYTDLRGGILSTNKLWALRSDKNLYSIDKNLTYTLIAENVDRILGGHYIKYYARAV